MPVRRFAPSATGHAHPGTVLAGLLAWLDARSCGARFVLRIEDLDPQRCTPELVAALIAELRWCGLDWDALEIQSDHHARHAAALDALAAAGRLYPCAAGRAELARAGRRSADGGWAYDNRHRGTPLPQGGWRACDLPLRAQLDDGLHAAVDLGGIALDGDPGRESGDPVVRRRDGAVSYQLAVVVDDAAIGVDRVVRGRDLATATASQVALQRLLGLPTPQYRHHLLLLEASGGKLAKLHGAVAVPELAVRYDGPALIGWLAWAAGLRDRPSPCRPHDLLAGFSWDAVAAADRTVTWDRTSLTLASPGNGAEALASIPPSPIVPA